MDTPQGIDSERLQQFSESFDALRDGSATAATLIHFFECIPGVPLEKARENIRESFQYFPDNGVALARLSHDPAGIIQTAIFFHDPALARVQIERLAAGKGSQLAINISDPTGAGTFTGGELTDIRLRAATHVSFISFDGSGHWEASGKQGEISIPKLISLYASQADLAITLHASEAVIQAGQSTDS